MVRFNKTYVRAPAQSWPDDCHFLALMDHHLPDRGGIQCRWPLLQTEEFHSNLTSTFHSLRLLFNKKAQSHLLNLFFFSNHTGYNDVVIRFRRSSSIGGQPFILSKELSEWRLYRKDRKKKVPLHAVQTILNDLPRLFQALSYTIFNRSLPSENMIRGRPVSGGVSTRDALLWCVWRGLQLQ